MAKGNLVMGTSSGKVGDLVTYRKHGAQITRVYNPNPANPRTDKQMIKRVQWASITPVYAQNMNILEQTFSRVPRGSSAQRQFYRFNYDKVLLAPKQANEFYKSTHKVPYGKFYVSYGSLPFFPASLVVDSDTYELYSNSVRDIHFNAERLYKILDAEAKEETSLSLSLGQLWYLYFKGTNYEGQRLGIITNKLFQSLSPISSLLPDEQDLLSSGFTYYEIHPHFLDDQPIKFVKETDGWHLEGRHAWETDIDGDNFKFVLGNLTALIFSPSDYMGGIAFFAIDPITKQTSTAQLRTALPTQEFQEWLNVHLTDDYIKMCIDSYKGEPTPPDLLFNV